MMHEHESAHFDVFRTRSTMLVDTDSENPGEGAPSNLCATSSPSGFDLIKQKGKNVLLHFWRPSDELRAAVAQAAFAELPSFTAVIAKVDLGALPEQAPDPLSARLLTELGRELAAFSQLLPANALRLELCKTRNRTCPLFHIDRVSFRMLCTLRGPGTEWLADGAVNRKQLGHGDNRKIVKQGAYVYEAEPFQVCILKGEALPGNAGVGAVHRSPAVPDTIDGRWYLRVDAA